MDFLETAAIVGLDPLTAAKARERLEAGEIVLLGLSGKLASGKDSVAEATISALGHPDATHHYYADAMKNEVDQAIAIIVQTPQGDDPSIRVADEQGVPLDQARKVTDWLVKELAENPRVHARSRTKGIRDVLQFWGTEIRRAQDPDYWVKKTLRGAIGAAASGRSVYITDVRFPNEVGYARALGFFVGRIEITPETQATRLAARDALPPTPETLAHASERALDDYDGFDAIIDNNGSLDQTVEALCSAILSRRPRST
jgi:dephospho-CoA kinase